MAASTGAKRKAVANPAIPLSGKKQRPDDMLTKVLSVEWQDSTWVLDSQIPMSEVEERWPNRELHPQYGTHLRLHKQKSILKPLPAVAHFGAVRSIDPDSQTSFVLKLGDFVECSSEPEDDKGKPLVDEDGLAQPYIVEVTELFEDYAAVRWMGVTWYYRPHESWLLVNVPGKRQMPADLPRTRLFRASDADTAAFATETLLSSAERVVKVEKRRPGAGPPTGGHYWYDSSYDRNFMTFEDCTSEPPASRAAWEGARRKRKLCALDLYAGCGGLSFLDQETDEVTIVTVCAVDMEPSMVASFEANYPEAHAHCMGVDEFLWFSKLFAALVYKYTDAWMATHHDSDGEEEDTDGEGSAGGSQRDYVVEKVHDIRFKLEKKSDDKRAKTKQHKGHLEKDLDETDCYLEFDVEWKGVDNSGKPWGREWKRIEDVAKCEYKVAECVRAMRSTCAIPIPGDIDVVVGGPPCQGMSGLNRHAKVVDILNDAKNRQLLAFFNIVQWFNPAFVLMENVADILKKSDGLYAKYAQARLLQLSYQTRLGMIAAAHHGAPQGRWRVFCWGAKAGQEQLPPFPEPTHLAAWHASVPTKAAHCVVQFRSLEAAEAAYPMTLLGDVYSDLPPVVGFTLAESQAYASEPQRPYQAWMRREPPAVQADLPTRARCAAEAMQASWDVHKRTIMSAFNSGKGENYVAVGRLMACKKNVVRHRQPPPVVVEEAPGADEGEGKKKKKKHVDHGLETVRAIVNSLSDEAGALFDLELDASLHSLHYHTGKKIMAALEEAERVARQAADDPTTLPLRDHRSLCLNLDDQIRCERIPRESNANFRQLPGVITHANGKCCAGHSHEARVGGKADCPAGGTRDHKQGADKANRVDHDDIGGWRGGFLQGCPAYSVFIPTGAHLCPRWCITFKKGKNNGRHGCYGRNWYDEIQPTVVGRAEPHNMALLHPEQDRVVTIRENARCQGFPDYFALVGKVKDTKTGRRTWVRSDCLTQRYIQMGNAVCPLVSSALGRGLALAAVGKAPQGQAVVSMPNVEYDQVMAAARAAGLKSYAEEFGLCRALQVQVDRLQTRLRDHLPAIDPSMLNDDVDEDDDLGDEVEADAESDDSDEEETL
ncbi:hypothetical protein WJX72_001381 [[Myrmecia] bisecta]|uniref:DNA (cytosine-5-)-methyltransferase n=1 Tax=[Myrmecia] bisecta TaxID=41462 RepID=A0AAW1QP65_9CHLO